MLKFAFTVFLLELTLGPNMAYLAALSLARGRVAGLIATAGIALGLATHAVLVALGAEPLFRAIRFYMNRFDGPASSIFSF